MARSARSSGGRSLGGSRMSGSKSRSSFGSFKSSGTRYRGGYRYRYRPYRRNRFYDSLSPTGKAIYIILLFILWIVLSFI